MNEIPVNTFFTPSLVVIRQLHMYEIDAVQAIFIAVYFNILFMDQISCNFD